LKTFLCVLLAAGLAVTCSSCSWMAMDRVPEDYQPTQKPDCSGLGWPVLDTILAGTSSLGTYALGDFDMDTLSALGVLTILLYAASAVTGFVWCNTCYKARQEHADWNTQRNELKLAHTDKLSTSRSDMPSWARSEYTPKIKIAAVPERYRTYCKYQPGQVVRVETKQKKLQAEFVKCEARGVWLKTKTKEGVIPFRKIWKIEKVTPDAIEPAPAMPAPVVEAPQPVGPEKTAEATPEAEEVPVEESDLTTRGAFVIEGVRAFWGMGMASSDHGPYTARRLSDKRARQEIADIFKRNTDVFASVTPDGLRAREARFLQAIVKKSAVIDRWIDPREELHYSVAVLALSDCGLEIELANMLWERLARKTLGK
jgi:hypothetical protein